MNVYTNILGNTILNNYFNSTFCLLIFINNYTSFDYNGSLPKVNLRLINASTENNYLNRFYGCNGFLINSNEPCSLFEKIEYLIKHSDERFNDRKYLVIPYDEDNYKIDDFMCLFEIKEMEYVDDILIILPNITRYSNNENISKINYFLKDDNEISFNLISNKYVGIYGNETILLDKWFSKNQSFLFNNNLYPDKIKNQEGRILKVATFTYLPYTITGDFNFLLFLSMFRMYTDFPFKK